MMLTQNGKLLYISDNAAEYLGHSMVSLNQIFYFITCFSVYLTLTLIPCIIHTMVRSFSKVSSSRKDVSMVDRSSDQNSL